MDIRIIEREKMPQGGVKELMKSSDGRRYLSELQKRHKDDILQPHEDPARFQSLYGEKIRKNREIREQQERDSRDQWEEREQKKQAARVGRKMFR